MSGLDLQAYLVDAGIRLPIVFITAHDDAATRERSSSRARCICASRWTRARLLGAISELLSPADQ